MEKSFKELLQLSFKSNDTEEWLDVWFTRPIGLVFALFWAKVGVTPNMITILSMFLGAGAGWMFLHADLWHNVGGVVLLMLANFCDSTDGQLARLTNNKTLIGRMLDGFASNVWFFFCYLAIVFRLWDRPLPFVGDQYGTWGIWGFFLCLLAGVGCHSRQASLADYYRQIHLYFVSGEEKSELDTSEAQMCIYRSLPTKGAFWDRAFYYFYASYCRRQERQTPVFQTFFAKVKAKYPCSSDIPQTFRDEFRRRSLPLMKYTNILTHNTRAIALFVACLIDEPWLYPLFEITVLSVIYIYMKWRHNQICRTMEV